MEHKPLTEINTVADVVAVAPKRMTRRERLERWAELLERDPTRELSSLEEIEFKPKSERRFLRADNSPLTVAFADPVLRAEGLASDRLGDASDFFGLTVNDAHFALCSCLYGRTMQAGEAASRVHRLADSDRTALQALSVLGGGIAAMLALSSLSGLLH
ncbi:MAG TPA: hypothetical protein VHG30_03200 [Microvirga sp.]|nr:hypothetical protein [Microvirga sp.]